MDEIKHIYSMVMQRDDKSLKNYLKNKRNQEKARARKIRIVANAVHRIYTA
ncbi:MAG: hypothetical protein ABIH25_00370 [Candidatus Woesearchaeota archaeon]